jgi:hypothetical protein
MLFTSHVNFLLKIKKFNRPWFCMKHYGSFKKIQGFEIVMIVRYIAQFFVCQALHSCHAHVCIIFITSHHTCDNVTRIGAKYVCDFPCIIIT